MMRLIDADDLIYLYFDDASGNKAFNFVPGEFIEKAPTVYAVEVVRCGQCKHRIFAEYNGAFQLLCEQHNGAEVRPDDFCSYGEEAEK